MKTRRLSFALLLFALIIGIGFRFKTAPGAYSGDLPPKALQDVGFVTEDSDTTSQTIRREEASPSVDIFSLVLWDKQKDVELQWANNKCDVAILLGQGFSLAEREGRLALEAPLLNPGSVELEIRYSGFFTRRVTLGPVDFKGSTKSTVIDLVRARKVKLRVSGAEEVFHTLCRIRLVDGFFADSLGDILFPLHPTREFEVTLEESTPGTRLIVELQSDIFGSFRWTLTNNLSNGDVVALELPEIVDFDVECRNSDSDGPFQLQIYRVLSNGLRLDSGGGTLFLERPVRYSLFAGRFELIGTNPAGHKAQKDISSESFKADVIPSIVLDFKVDQVAITQKGPALPANIIVPHGTVRFSLRYPEGVNPSIHGDIRLWQFSPSRHRKDLCTLSDRPRTFTNLKPLECSFRGRPERLQGFARFGLEIVVSGVKQGGLAIIEVPYDSEVLDFGEIELGVPGDLLLYVGGLEDLDRYSIALAPTSLGYVQAEELSNLFGEFLPEAGCFLFNNCAPGDYEIGAFRDGQLASSSQLYVPPPHLVGKNSLSCDLLPPGVVTVVASRQNEPLVEYSVSSIQNSFWPLNYVQSISLEITNTDFFCPTGVDLVVTAWARLVSGGGLNPILYVPFTLDSHSHLEINLMEPPGGVIEGIVQVDNTEFPFLMAIPSNLRRRAFIGADGSFRLTGCEQGPFELFLLDYKFQRWPLSSYEFELQRGRLLPSGEIVPEN